MLESNLLSEHESAVYIGLAFAAWLLVVIFFSFFSKIINYLQKRRLKKLVQQILEEQSDV
jgi:uncharacterized membrane protein